MSDPTPASTDTTPTPQKSLFTSKMFWWNLAGAVFYALVKYLESTGAVPNVQIVSAPGDGNYFTIWMPTCAAISVLIAFVFLLGNIPLRLITKQPVFVPSLFK
jgi:hypothetical protein